jgi:hypothetical protein
LNFDKSGRWLATDCEDKHARVFAISDGELNAHPELAPLYVAGGTQAPETTTLIL